MSDMAEGVLTGLIGGIGGGASAMANIYKDERQNAAKVENETQLAEAKAQIEEERAKRIADYNEAKRREGKAADLKFEQENAATTNKLAADKAKATDVGAPLRNEQIKGVKISNELEQVKLKVAQDEIKLPAAEKKLFDAYQKEFDQNNAAIAKARAENTYDENSPSGKALADENMAIRTKMESLLSPFLKPNEVSKKGNRAGLDKIFGNNSDQNPKETSPTPTGITAPQAAPLLPSMDIQQVNQELMKMGEPKMGWSKSDYSKYNQLIAMQKAQMGKK